MDAIDEYLRDYFCLQNELSPFRKFLFYGLLVRSDIYNVFAYFIRAGNLCNKTRLYDCKLNHYFY